MQSRPFCGFIVPRTCSVSPPCSHSLSYDPTEVEKHILVLFFFFWCIFLPILGKLCTWLWVHFLVLGWSVVGITADLKVPGFYSWTPSQCSVLGCGEGYSFFCGLCFLRGRFTRIRFTVRVTSQLVWNEVLSHLGYLLHLALNLFPQWIDRGQKTWSIPPFFLYLHPVFWAPGFHSAFLFLF